MKLKKFSWEEEVEKWENSENKIWAGQQEHITHFEMFQDTVFKNSFLSCLCTKPAFRGQAHSTILNRQSYGFKRHMKANLKIQPFLTLMRKVNSN